MPVNFVKKNEMTHTRCGEQNTLTPLRLKTFPQQFYSNFVLAESRKVGHHSITAIPSTTALITVPHCTQHCMQHSTMQ